jgi:hypothetical protein
MSLQSLRSYQFDDAAKQVKPKNGDRHGRQRGKRVRDKNGFREIQPNI